MKSRYLAAVCSALLGLSSTDAATLGGAFTYQGCLNSGLNAANGYYDFQFTLYDGPSRGAPVGPVVSTNGVLVINGLFAVTLDFGVGAFNGEPRWLELAVTTNGGGGFVTMGPRQPLTAAPYAFFAPAADSAARAGEVAWGGVTGKPGGFADNLDNDTLYSAGAGLSLIGTQFNVSFAGSGIAGNVARSDHGHAGIYSAIDHNHDGTYSIIGHVHSAADVASGTLADARLSVNVALRGSDQAFGGSNSFNGVVIATNPLNVIVGNFAGRGGGLTGLDGGSLAPGTVGRAALEPRAITEDKVAAGQVVKSINGLRDDLMMAAGENLTVTPGGQTISLASPTDWHVSGNAGTSPGAHFLGTTDGQRLEFRVNNTHALRLEPTAEDLNHSGIVNVIGGSAANQVLAGVYGATIGGGGAGWFYGVLASNRVEADFSTLAGGMGNWVWPQSLYGTIGGGVQNWIRSNSVNATIAGGRMNLIDANVRAPIVSGGEGNIIRSYSDWATINGGLGNTVETNATYATVSGGWNNRASAPFATLGGGSYNGAFEDWATIAGGRENLATNLYATVPGGRNNLAGGPDSFAAGRRASALHQGAFVWADSTDADFVSTADDQFLIRAGGNVGIGKNNPATTLDVNGTVTATAFSGDGGALTGIDAASLSSGAVPDERLSPNVALRAGGNAFTGQQTVAGGNVGIGTTAPARRLHVSDGVGNQGSIQVGEPVGSSDPKLIYFGDGQYVYVGENGADDTLELHASRFHFSNGYVGIGNAYPQAALDVNGTTRVQALEGSPGQPLELAVDGQRALRLEPAGAPDEAPNVIGGAGVNSVADGVLAATIAGGGYSDNSGSNAPNTIAANYATIGGGIANSIETGAEGATIGGGEYSVISAQAFGATISGGADNMILNDAWAGTVGGGTGNGVSGDGATVPGGAYNNASGLYSFAAGQRAKATHDGAFVWADSNNFDFDPYAYNGPQGAANSFNVRATGGFYIVTGITDTGDILNGATLTSGSGTWGSYSDRNAKTNCVPVDPQAVLDKVAALPIATWNYKTQDPSIRHMGPMAQDFYTSFSIGDSEKTITTLDADGVALAAIQGLNQKLEEKNATLEKQVAELKALVEALASKASEGRL